MDCAKKGLESRIVFELREQYMSDNKSWFRNSLDVEIAFRKLIKIGVLRREVDGQGLTSKIRLTPLGRQMLELKNDPTFESTEHEQQRLGRCKWRRNGLFTSNASLGCRS